MTYGWEVSYLQSIIDKLAGLEFTREGEFRLVRPR